MELGSCVVFVKCAKLLFSFYLYKREALVGLCSPENPDSRPTPRHEREMSQKGTKCCEHADELKRLDEYIKNLQEERRMSKQNNAINKHACEEAWRSNECDECFSELYEDDFSVHGLRWGGGN